MRQITDPKRIRINLLMSSLYLSAFEVMKSTIIDVVANISVYLPEPNEAHIAEMKGIISETEYQALYDANVGAYRNQIEEYERELGIDYENRFRFGLIPSCHWLERHGVLEETDLDTVFEVRNHRNELAHELPTLLLDRQYSVDMDRLEDIWRILRKVGIFWARLDADIPDHVRDEDIIPGTEAIVIVIQSAVAEYLKELVD